MKNPCFPTMGKCIGEKSYLNRCFQTWTVWPNCLIIWPFPIGRLKIDKVGSKSCQILNEIFTISKESFFIAKPGTASHCFQNIDWVQTIFFRNVLKFWYILKKFQKFWEFLRNSENDSESSQLGSFVWNWDFAARSRPWLNQLYSSDPRKHGFGIFFWREHAHGTFPDAFIIK